MSSVSSSLVRLEFDATGQSDRFTGPDKVERNARGGNLRPARCCSVCRCINGDARGFCISSVPGTRCCVSAPSIEARAVVMRDSSIHRPRLAGSSIRDMERFGVSVRIVNKANGIVTSRKRGAASMRATSHGAVLHRETPHPLNGLINEGKPATGGSGGYYALYPRGRGASEGAAPDGYVMMSRWASSEEAESWLRNGGTAIQSGIGGDRVYVTLPDGLQPAGTGPIRIDFAVPKSALIQTSNPQWRIIMQPIQSTPIHNVTIVVPNGTRLAQ